jgi:hypothetical protein
MRVSDLFCPGSSAVADLKRTAPQSLRSAMIVVRAISA